MCAITDDGAIFESHWNTSVGGGVLVVANSRSVQYSPPHGISLENGILQISAWIGKGPASIDLFKLLCDSARRILGVTPSIGDSFEDKFRDLLNPSLASGNGDETLVSEDDDDDTADNKSSNSTTRNPRPKVTTVVIHLICHPDCVESDLSDWNDEFIPLGDNFIRVIVRVIRANMSVENIPVIDAFSNIFQSGTDELLVALVRFRYFIPLLNRGNEAYAANIRSWLGDHTVTNSRLKDVFNDVANGNANVNPEMFPLNHNGVSICCNGMTKTGSGSLSLGNPQIINGQQTLHGWWDAYNAQKDPVRRERLENLVVMVRIVKTKLKSTLDQITFANNRQNAVSAVDLRSNEACMVTIEKAFNFTGSKCLFQRKKGFDNHRGLDAGLIFATWKFIADESISAETFFDEKTKFDSLFVKLADVLTKGSAQDKELRRNRLIGLWQFSKLKFGAQRRTAIADVLNLLGISLIVLGGAIAAAGNGPTPQRRLVYALWPLIQQGVMHLMLKTPQWQGVDHAITLLARVAVGNGRRAVTVWSPTAATRALIGSLPRLSSSLITDFMTDYKKWISTEGIVENDWDPEALFAEFVSEKVTLDEMLRRMGVIRADLVTDL